MTKQLQFIAITALLFIANHSFAGGGWVHEKGKGYFKLSQWWVIADQHYTTLGKVDPNATTGVLNSSIYGEYGITDKLTAQIYFPFLSYAFVNEQISATDGSVSVPGAEIYGLGDTDISIKYGLVRNKPIVLSAYLTLGLPIGNANKGSSNGLQTGDGEFNQILGLVASTGGPVLDGVNLFASLGADYSNRTRGFSDEWRVNFEVGTVIKDKLILIYKLTSLNSTNNGDTVMDNPTGGLFSNNREYLSFTYEVGYNITEKFGVTANYGGAYSGQLIMARPSYSFGVYMNLK